LYKEAREDADETRVGGRRVKSRLLAAFLGTVISISASQCPVVRRMRAKGTASGNFGGASGFEPEPSLCPSTVPLTAEMRAPYKGGNVYAKLECM
jgi:hypothetical protein